MNASRSRVLWGLTLAAVVLLAFVAIATRTEQPIVTQGTEGEGPSPTPNTSGTTSARHVGIRSMRDLAPVGRSVACADLHSWPINTEKRIRSPRRGPYLMGNADPAHPSPHTPPPIFFAGCDGQQLRLPSRSPSDPRRSMAFSLVCQFDRKKGKFLDLRNDCEAECSLAKCYAPSGR